MWESGIINGFGDYSDSHDSDGKDLEVYEGFAEDLTVNNIEQATAV